MLISELIEMLEKSKRILGDVKVCACNKEICGINNEGDYIEIIL